MLVSSQVSFHVSYHVSSWMLDVELDMLRVSRNYPVRRGGWGPSARGALLSWPGIFWTITF